MSIDQNREHPDYPPPSGDPQGDRCICGGIRHWHAVAPYGCDDCDCAEFTRYDGLHRWYWTGLDFRCTLCGEITMDEQALAEMREPDDDLGSIEAAT